MFSRLEKRDGMFIAFIGFARIAFAPPETTTAPEGAVTR